VDKLTIKIDFDNDGVDDAVVDVIKLKRAIVAMIAGIGSIIIAVSALFA
jgi:hypothetical protein